MVKLFGKKYPPISTISLEGSWSISQGTYDGKIVIVRFSDDAKRIAGHPDYQFQVGIAVPINSPTEDGLPQTAEMEELNKIEDILINQFEANNESLLVAVITTGGMREFVFYTSAPQQVKEKFKTVQEKTETHELQLMIKPDKNWETYNILSK